MLLLNKKVQPQTNEMFVKNGNNRLTRDLHLHLELIDYEANLFILLVEKKLNNTWILMRKLN